MKHETQVSLADIFDIPADLQTFYNTTSLSGPALKESTIKTGSQNFYILAVFKASQREWTASEVWNNHRHWNCPLTSVRRGISDLVHKFHKLEYTGEQRIGMYGKPEKVAAAIILK